MSFVWWIQNVAFLSTDAFMALLTTGIFATVAFFILWRQGFVM